ncbi:MAG: biosynthetic arginine decarboxylase [Deltaproteobacteria bacterium]|nr:biosynthetic arginine decarboxylase [Deltaproteobacteria bacterium]
MEAWSINDSLDLYNVCAWGAPYMDINEAGHLVVKPRGDAGPSVDMKDLVDSLMRRGLSPPILLRFSDILQHRIETLCKAFENAIDENEYLGEYRFIMPIKVNQQRWVIEELLEHGRPFHVGLEAGSKPELFVALAMVDDPDALIICNGYKDREYLETALMAQKLGRQVLVVVDRFAELPALLDIAAELSIRPRIGVRTKLNSKGSGKWIESAGDRSKFGLNPTELIQAVSMLRERDYLDCLELLHFHLGSQINNIAAVKNALREASRLFVDLRRMGADLKFMDVGGGLAVDYDGSRTNFHSSMNYSVQEYANDVVWAVEDACRQAEEPVPTLLSESGRAVAAHHAMLIFDVLGVNKRGSGEIPKKPAPDDHNVLHLLWEVYNAINRKGYQEAFNDLLEYRAEVQSLYLHGVINLEKRAYAEELGWACAQKLLRVIRGLDYVPDDFEDLEKVVSDTYYCNFSVFQSAPDHWAVKQLFPVMPIHRLGEKPTRAATIADLTCDSDGKIDRFIDMHDVRDTLPLHPLGDDPYLLGVFMVGAYQEILGDLHNLFGDTNTVNIRLDEDGETCDLNNVTMGESVSEVLSYMRYTGRKLSNKLRTAAEMALKRGEISPEDVRVLMQHFDRGLMGYTYLEDN